MNVGITYIPSADLYYRLLEFYSLSTVNLFLNIKNCIVFFNTLIINFPIYTIIYITHKYVMNQTNTHNNNIIYAYIARCPGRLSLVEKYTGHVRSRVRICPAPWGMSAQEHTFTFCQIFFISGGNYTLITCIQYTTMVTHSECEISQSWRTVL